MKYNVTNSFNEPPNIVRRAGEPEEQQIPGSFGEAAGDFFKRNFSKEGFRRFCRNNLPAKGDSGKEVTRKIIRSVSFIVLIACAIFYINYYIHYRAQVKQYDTLSELVIDDEFFGRGDENQQWEAIKSKYPSVDFPADMDIKFANLYAINSDVIGYLTIPNTNIRTVIMQTDENDYYLYHNIYRQSSRYGNPYVDADCKIAPDGTSKNIIIYGHNTHDGLMFHQLTNYMTLEGYKKAPVIQFETLYDKSEWKIFAVMLTNSTSDADNGFVFTYLYPDFVSDSAFMSLMSDVYARSMIHTGVDVRADDDILTLYTCYQNIFKGGRLVVFARRVRDGESPEVDTSKAYYDSSAIFPQAYYDAVR